MRRIIMAISGLIAAIWVVGAQAEVRVMAVRLGADDVVRLAEFYEAAFGLKEIDRVGEPVTEIIMRYGATAAEARSGTSPEFLVQRRESAAGEDTMAHAIFHVSDLAATVAAAKAAGASMEGAAVTVPIGGMPVTIAMITDPDGNTLELMELPDGTDHLPHP